jgi:hypothetical protein
MYSNYVPQAEIAAMIREQLQKRWETAPDKAPYGGSWNNRGIGALNSEIARTAEYIPALKDAKVTGINELADYLAANYASQGKGSVSDFLPGLIAGGDLSKTATDAVEDARNRAMQEAMNRIRSKYINA